MTDKIEEEAMRRGQRKRVNKGKKKGTRRESIRGVMAEEVRKVRTRDRRMTGASNVANQATMLLSTTPKQILIDSFRNNRSIYLPNNSIINIHNIFNLPHLFIKFEP